MPENCPNHGLTVEQKVVAMERLAIALALLSNEHIPQTDGVREELRHAQIYSGVQGLAMDIGVIAFEQESRLARHKIAYTADWLLQREAREIATQIEEDIRERLSVA